MAKALHRALRAACGLYDLSDRYDDQTVAIMKRVLAPDSNCIDVGLHTGAILDIILRFAPKGRHWAFEPLPHLYSAASRKYAASPNVQVIDAALSDSTGTSSFQHVVTNPAYSGILKRRYDRPDEQVAEIRVRLLQLDDVIPPGIDIRLIKIDVEGAELHVLLGARNTLLRCHPYIVFEHGLGAADAYSTQPETLFDFLKTCGLSVSLMSDWLNPATADSRLSREAFAHEFNTGRNYYFLAHP